ncbi:DUF1758 domain-containing protein [Trichonephila clavata]|uniref:DUF1758 domain-containing protein n=1 Tax=Trichonephila clavata TaxID=2740835 RepID=A0A8X6HNE2_TRICU|nr:DUF1758 domain-containing protein [Trichonephila clavata]
MPKLLKLPTIIIFHYLRFLEQRYENRRIIVDSHIKNILNCQTIRHESTKDLRYLLDCINKNLRSLKSLEFERDKFSNALLLNIILDKLDRETRKQFEIILKDNEVPDFDQFLIFLERRDEILNSINSNLTKPHIERSLFVNGKNETSKICLACKNNTHALYLCHKFKEMKFSERMDVVKMNRLCFNCLGQYHNLPNCNSNSSCLVCKKSQLSQLLLRGGMNLHKWCSNVPQFNEQELSQQWEAFIDTLQYLETISVPRCVLLTSVKSIVVQGFADASSKAYGAVVYIQAVSKTGETRSQLLYSKSRVASLKIMTIPRLELAACLLLLKLTNKVLAALKENVDSVKLWIDSSIALSWINTSPHLLLTEFPKSNSCRRTSSGDAFLKSAALQMPCPEVWMQRPLQLVNSGGVDLQP